MNCREIDRDECVEKYLRGELHSAQQDEFETHILGCGGCLQALETLQDVRDDLTQRAHEIRIQPVSRSAPPRWEWIAVTSFLLVAASMGLAWYGHRRTMAISPPQAKSEQTQKENKEANTASNPSVLPAPTQQRQRQPQSKAKSDLPLKPAPLPASTEAAKNIELATPSLPQMAPGSHEEKVATDAPHVGGAIAQPKLASNDTVSDEMAKELFRLGVVQAPPYTFSGFAASTKISKSHNTGSTRDAGLGAAVSTSGTRDAQSAEGARASFQNAMDAYVERRYSNAAALLEEAVRAEPNAADANFFLGVCRLLLAKPADSIAPLHSALANEKSPFTQSAHFYLAKAYIQTGNLTQAEAQLQAAGAMTGRLGVEARSLLNRLRALRTTEEKPKQSDTTRNPD